MKKAMVYILALTMVFSVLLSGCGETRTNRREATNTDQPQASASPEIATPDPDDGVVKDTDGVITDGDTGGLTDDKVAGDGVMGNTIPAGTNNMDQGNNGTGGTNSGNGKATGTNGTGATGGTGMGGTGAGTVLP